jgi:uncharacterized protein (TIGR00251 family)
MTMTSTSRRSTDNRLAVKVTPHARADSIDGWRDEAREELAVKVRAVAEDGKANNAVIGLIASSLKLPKGAITIMRGQAARHKLLSIDCDPGRFDSWKSSIGVI